MNRYDVQFNVLLLLFCCSIRPRFIIRIEVTLIYILRPKRDDLASIEIVSSAFLQFHPQTPFLVVYPQRVPFM